MKKFTKIIAVTMLVAFVALAFSSCGLFGMDMFKVAERLSKKGYAFEIESENGQMYVEAYDEDEEDYFEAIKFESKSDVEDFVENELENTEWDSDETYGVKGKVVYWGTVQGVKDALGFPANILVN